MEILNTFLRDIANETNGFGLGEPHHPGSDSIVAIVPITRQMRRQRDYITLSEAGERVSIKDTGSIDEVIVTNNTEKPIFIPAAWMLSGETQTRIVAQGVVILPSEIRNISVACVQESRGISTNAILRPDTIGPRSVEQELYRERGRGTDRQSGVWRADREYGEKVMPVDEADDLLSAHSRRVRAAEKLVSQLPELPDQVGFAIMVPKGVGSLECFDLPDSWRAIGRLVIEKEVEAISQKREDFASVFEYKPHKAHSLLRAFLRRKFLVEAVVSGPNWKTIGISASDYVGEVTIMANNIIHVSLGRKEY